MRLLTGGAILALALVAIAVSGALFSTPTAASDDVAVDRSDVGVQGLVQEESATGDERRVDAQAIDGEERPFIGVVVKDVPEEEAQELGIDGGVLIVGVRQGGPADGQLSEGDVITALDGDAVTTVEQLIDKIAQATVGEEVTFTVLRDGASIEVTLTVGGRAVGIRGPYVRRPYVFGTLLGQLHSLPGNLSSLQAVLGNDEEGYKTYRVTVGSVGTVDVEARTFTVEPLDASDPIAFQVSEDTEVIVRNTGTLEGLSPGTEVVVLDVDGVVSTVRPSGGTLDPRLGGPGQAFSQRGHLRQGRGGFQHGQVGPKRAFGAPNARPFAPQGRSFRFQFNVGPDDLPAEVRERIERFRAEIQERLPRELGEALQLDETA